MRKLFFLLVLGLNLEAKISQKELKEGEYEIIIIQKGDTLWDLAGKYIGKCYEWEEFEKYNYFTDPHWIYPGEKLAIGIKEGKVFIKKVEEFEREFKQKIEEKNRESARLKEELERLKTLPLKKDEEVIEKQRLKEDVVESLKAEQEAFQREVDKLRKKLLDAEERFEIKDEIEISQRKERERLEKALIEQEEEKEEIVKEEKIQRRYKEILAIASFVAIVIFNSLR